jgi:DNA segregation ATPase FtsK/SpoIIIE, S-DNA-T family
MPRRGPNRKLKRGDKRERETSPRPRSGNGSRDVGVVSGILLMALGALIGLALGSSTRTAGNLAGAVGSWLAARLLAHLGLLSFLLPLGLACVSVEALHLLHWTGRRLTRLAATVVGAIATALVGQILWPELRTLGAPLGGSLLRLLAVPLVDALSTVGSVLVVAAVGLAALAVASDYALSRAGAWALRGLWALSRKGLGAAWVFLHAAGHAAWKEHLEARAEPDDGGIDPSALDEAAEDEVQRRSDLAATRGAAEDPDEWNDASVEQLGEEDIEELAPEILMVGLDGRVRGSARKTPPPIELPAPEPSADAAVETTPEPVGREALAPSPSAAPSIVETQALAPTKRKQKRGAFRLFQSGKGFKLPSLDLLDSTPEIRSDIDRNALTETAQRLTAKLADFGIKGRVETIRPGPVITMYEFVPAPGIRVSKIASLVDDLAMAMEALQVRIVAPIPGKNVVGIEVPNRHRAKVTLKEMLEDEAFQKMTSPLTLAFGKDTEGAPYVGDLTRMPHLLVAGTTGSGKSVSMNSMIMSLLFKASPDDVRLILIDPKMVELSAYEGIPHLLLPVVQDSQKAPLALRWAVEEMERRYQLIGRLKVKDIRTYNEKIEQLGRGERLEEPVSEAPKKVLVVDVAAGETEEEALALMQEAKPQEVSAQSGADAAEPEVKLPYIVIIIDELADLMMVASREMEQCIARLAAKARAAGIHLVVATQRPSTDVISGVIKSNLPVRIAFRLASRHDSATIINGPGAERLLGEGDMLHIPPGGSDAIRLHGALVRDGEIERVVDFWKQQAQPIYDEDILRPRPEDREGGGPESVPDEIYDQALDVVGRLERVSISLLQRKMGVGYNRAADLIERMEREGVVGPANGVKPREVLIRPLGLMEA